RRQPRDVVAEPLLDGGREPLLSRRQGAHLLLVYVRLAQSIGPREGSARDGVRAPNFLLSMNDPVQQAFRGRRTAGNVDVYLCDAIATAGVGDGIVGDVPTGR